VPASQVSPAGTAPSVLLVEEYDALAAAITSALKKFAPGHRVRAVESLADAEASVAETSPLLVIVDVDPPRSNIIEFFARVAADHPNARCLVIGSGVPPELNSARPGPNALQFIDKPFELPEFGAAVQALLGPWTTAAGDSRGTLGDLNVRDLIALQCLNLATAVLHLRSPNDRGGEIHFLDGQITHAATGNSSGVGALHQMMRWKTGGIRETERMIDAPRTIHGAWMQVFLEGLRQMGPVPEEPQALVVAPPPVTQPPVHVARTGKKIVVIDDTEMLLIFVEDALATADPTLQITTAFTGSEGARRAEVTLPDLILLDYSLPDLRGDQVCQRLSQNEATARIPVVMMSGHVSEMAAAARKCPNIVATIAKPFMSDALVALVKETLTKGPLPSSAPVRQGNGKKPAKKNGAGAAKAAAEKAPAPVPEPRAPAPTSAPPASAEIISAAPPPIVIQPADPPPPLPTAPMEPAPVAPTPIVAPAAPAPGPRPAHLAATNGSSVVLGLGMEVIAVQLTPGFQVGTIRARPTASTLSLTHSSEPTGNLLAGFEIGPVELGPDGRIQTLRVVPMRRPAKAIEARNAFAINDLALVNQNAAIQMTAGAAAPMTMQLVALFKVAGVELSDRFEVAQLVLKPAADRVHVTLDPQSRSGSGTEFETVQVRLDASQRIAEFVLNSAAR
jgi:two-component system, OmpR family, alkaline phosphatase synthesis response regulator PhoP